MLILMSPLHLSLSHQQQHMVLIKAGGDPTVILNPWDRDWFLDLPLSCKLNLSNV